MSAVPSAFGPLVQSASLDGDKGQLDVIRLIGDVLTELDVLRADFDRGTANRTRLDNLRDDIDAFERKVVRTSIEENTTNFRESTAAKSSQ
jgi:hypothetical protein